jgi:hypothetical protein
MKIIIIDRCQKNWSKEFSSKKACRKWLMEGIAGCDGAERDHFVNMLLELEDGEKTLHYN